MLLEHTDFGGALLLSNIYLGVSLLLTADLLAHGSEGAVGLIHGIIYIFESFSLIFSEGIFW